MRRLIAVVLIGLTLGINFPPQPGGGQRIRLPTVDAAAARSGTHMYISDTGNNRIVRIDDMTGTGWMAFGTSGTGPGQFHTPRGIFVDPSGRIYVADEGNSRIVRINDMTGAGWVTLTAPSDAFGPGFPDNILVDETGRIFFTDGSARIIRVDSMTGAGRMMFGTLGPQGKDFGRVNSIAMDAAGRLYVADGINAGTYWMNVRIVRMNDMTGAGWITLDPGDKGVHRFIPLSVFVASVGRIYVVDADYKIVRMNDMTGAGWTTLGTRGSSVMQFTVPRSLFVDSSGQIYVADAGNDRIVRMNDMTGAEWTTWGTKGSGANQFAAPNVVFVR